MPATFILIPGRTAKQGCGVSEGKLTAGYREETGVLQLAPEDLDRLGLAPGDRVRLANPHGRVELPVAAAKKGELPQGVAFLPYGDLSSRLMGPDTHASGMPTSKGIDVQLEKLP